MFRSLLIANRGEIACRVIRTARRLGLRTIAVHSEADAGALHARQADEARPIGPAPARDSYLSIPHLIAAARAAAAEAIHPGYGFLAENADFAEACAEAGIIWVGPPPAAIRAMGSKSAAKALMERSGVPLVPGYHGADQDPDLLAAEAARIGFPVLIKPSAGGGGKGMRVVERPEDFAAALAGARREAGASFGDEQVLIERYLTRPRHIEVQVFADTQGHVVALHERDCSIQRRHQKIVEEAPAPGLTAEQRRQMAEAACAAARAVGYVGAGTIEFIAEGDAFYFMEMNTRLQVEHPVTEAITGQDLVEWQLRIAAGEALPLAQDEIPLDGHAIEVRVYAEDPARDFRPSTGTLVHLRAPAEDEHVRIDTGVEQGDAITPYYDPMIAKLIVRDRDRAGAIRRLGQALGRYEIAGVATNLGLLAAIAADPEFRAGALDTGFIDRNLARLLPAPAPADRVTLAAASLRLLEDRRRTVAAEAARSGDPWSPWHQLSCWRLNGRGYLDFSLRDGEAELALRLRVGPDGRHELALPGGVAAVAGMLGPDGVGAVVVDGVRVPVTVLRRGDQLTVLRGGLGRTLLVLDPLAPVHGGEADAGHLAAPMPGRVTKVHCKAGDKVARGAPLLVLEAMKMEHAMTAPYDGTVESLRCAEGDMVEEGAELVILAEAGP